MIYVLSLPPGANSIDWHRALTRGAAKQAAHEVHCFAEMTRR